MPESSSPNVATPPRASSSIWTAVARAAPAVILAVSVLWSAFVAVGASVARGYEQPPVSREIIVCSDAAWLLAALAFVYVRAGARAMLATAVPVALVGVGQVSAFEGRLPAGLAFAPACVVVFCLGATAYAGHHRKAGRWLIACAGLLAAHFTWGMAQATEELLRGKPPAPEISVLLVSGPGGRGLLGVPVFAVLLVLDAVNVLWLAYRVRRRRPMSTPEAS